MKVRCPHKISCPGSDSPLMNLSMEDDAYTKKVAYCCDGSLVVATEATCEDANAALAAGKAACPDCAPAPATGSLSDIGNYACFGEDYSQVITATGLDAETLWFELYSGALPFGLTFHGGKTTCGTATIDGTIGAYGAFAFSVRACDGQGNCIQKDYTLNVMELTPASLPDAEVGVSYSEALGVAFGIGPYHFDILSGNPPGLDFVSLYSSVITGTPSVAGDYSMIIRVDDMGTGKACLFTRNITVASSKICTYGAGDKLDNDGSLITWVNSWITPESCFSTEIPYYSTGLYVVSGVTYRPCIFRQRWKDGLPMPFALGEFTVKDAYAVYPLIPGVTLPCQKYVLEVRWANGLMVYYVQNGATFDPKGAFSKWYDPANPYTVHPDYANAPSPITLT